MELSSLYLKKCNFIYLTHPPPQGLNSLVLPIIWAEPAVVTVIIRIYGGQVLCVNHMLAIHASMHISLTLRRRRREKKEKSHLVLCSYIVFPFIRDKHHMAYLFLSHTGTLKSTMGVAPGTYEPAGCAQCSFSSPL